jgi:hypothetical protein
MIYVLNYRDKIPNNITVINTTSRSTGWSKGLSPMIVGPVMANGIECHNVENAWQYTKVYDEHVDEHGDPTKEYFIWRDNGYRNKWAQRYPAGKGRKPLYSFWDGQKMDYISARAMVYIPLYASAVKSTNAFSMLKNEYKKHGDIVLLDFDAYNHHDLNMTWEEVIACENKKMGHAFVLAMLLEGIL